MIFEEFLAVVRCSKEFWNFSSSPNDKCFLGTFIIWIHILIFIIIHLILSNLKISKLTKSSFESLGFKAVCSHYNQVNFILSENLLKVLLVLSMLPSLFFLTRSHLILSSISTSSWLSRRNNIEEVFMSYQLSKLINNGNGCLEIAVVYRIHDSSHYIKTLFLRNQILFNSSSLFNLLLHLILDLKVSSAHHHLILLIALINDILLSILLELILDFIYNTHQERLAALICLSILCTKYLKDFSPEESPLGGILWELEIVKHLLEKLVANLIGRNVLDVVLYHDCVSYEAKRLVLNDVQEEVIGHIFKLFGDTLDPVAGMEDVKLFQAFFGRL